MAHRILGIDIGRRRVKVAVVDKSMRNTALNGFDSEPVAEPYDEEAQQAALERVLARVRRPDDVVMAGLPASDVLHRVLSFPFSDERALTEAAGFELETHVPIDLEDAIVDEVVVERRDDGCDALVVAAPHERVQARIDLLRGAGAEPRQLGLVAISMAHLIGQLPELGSGTVLLLDVGALGTEAVVVRDGQAAYVRSLSIGSEAVRETFAAQFDTSALPPGGDLLATHGLLLPPGMPPQSDAEATLSRATLAAVTPWLREVRQTLSVWRKGGRGGPDRIILTGGMAGLRGLHDTLESAVGVPVRGLALDGLEMFALSGTAASQVDDYGAAAVALALEGAAPTGGQTMDFRQGEFAWEGDYKFVRERLPALAAFVVIALCLLAVRTTISYRGLVVEAAQQVATLSALSKALTGKKSSNFDKLKGELERPIAVDLAAYYPDLSAIRVLDEVTSIQHKVTEPPEFKPGGPAQPALPGVQVAQVVAPPPRLRGVPPLGMVAPGRPGSGSGFRPAAGPADDGGGGGGGDEPAVEGGGEDVEKKGEFTGHKIELLSIDIDRTKASLRGDCDTQDALLAFQTSLEKHPCFHKIKSTSDRITFERHRDWFRFNIGFEIACPKAQSGEPEGKAGKAGKAGKGEDKGGDAEGDDA